MIKNGILTQCPLCKSTEEPKKVGLSYEFDRDILTCGSCGLMSVRDLTHGVTSDSLTGSSARAKTYRHVLAEKFPKIRSVLEIGPGDWKFLRQMASHGGVKKLISIDVGDNFRKEKACLIQDMDKKGKELDYHVIEPPVDPVEIFEVSRTMVKIIREECEKNGKLDLCISLHSLEHSPNPAVLASAIATYSKTFVIEVPDGVRSLAQVARDADLVKRRQLPVGGHYQWFTMQSLEFMAKNLFPPGEYYIGRPHLKSENAFCITNSEKFLSKNTHHKWVLIKTTKD